MLQIYDQPAQRNSISQKILAQIQKRILKWLGVYELYNLQSMVIELDSVTELKKLFGWKNDPILDDADIYNFEVMHDINERRIRDAEVIATIVQNTKPSVCLDIGTAEGHSAALMSVNAPKSQVYTINIPPEEITSGEGGVYTTFAMERERIGSYYKSRKLSNITQIISNTAKWEPNIGVIDVAFVDGSHDKEFVYNDTVKILDNAKPGSFILWHDFSLEWWNKLPWVYDVCQGVSLLRERGKIKGYILHVRNSWIGIYIVP
jgi:predicted O-methyltransferase YrrM